MCFDTRETLKAKEVKMDHLLFVCHWKFFLFIFGILSVCKSNDSVCVWVTSGYINIPNYMTLHLRWLLETSGYISWGDYCLCVISAII